jgi:HAE1 family hydrophobic/amphiphilic exporter-1
MTTLALIAGMIPVALGLGEGADFRAPARPRGDRRTITSTFLTLFVIPTVYEIFDEWRAKLGARFRRGRQPVPAHGDAVPEPRATENGNAA